ncbi:hypothetical protein E2C01_090349 [Portunus trituberculatus]|uniref:Secreted protein n=1 Tax=Portunus trituberculatus TaxID=210409 RepID=A0A5B7JGC1_PORTR|nr:hypothetical protein [Portunus trituberculatus]
MFSAEMTTQWILLAAALSSWHTYESAYRQGITQTLYIQQRITQYYNHYLAQPSARISPTRSYPGGPDHTGLGDLSLAALNTTLLACRCSPFSKPITTCHTISKLIFF